MTAKIGIIGGVGWPGTVAYYEALCRRARPVGATGSPAMTIESLDMATTIAARGNPGNEKSWQSFDRIFSKAVARLAGSGCDLAAIASVTPHARLSSIAAAAPIPIVSLIDAIGSELRSAGRKSALILGTRPTMQGRVFDAALERNDCARIETSPSQVAGFSELLERYFYQGRGDEGRAVFLDFIKPMIGGPASTTVVLACTDLAPAFPEIGNRALFSADGYQFLDATSAHVSAILQAAHRIANSV